MATITVVWIFAEDSVLEVRWEWSLSDFVPEMEIEKWIAEGRDWLELGDGDWVFSRGMTEMEMDLILGDFVKQNGDGMEFAGDGVKGRCGVNMI